MYVRDVIVKNKVGLHARPATFFIQRANEYQSSIWVERDERRVNAKACWGFSVWEFWDSIRSGSLPTAPTRRKPWMPW